MIEPVVGDTEFLGELLIDESIMIEEPAKCQTEAGQTPSLLGQAIVHGGVETINQYKGIVSTLLKNDLKRWNS